MESNNQIGSGSDHQIDYGSPQPSPVYGTQPDSLFGSRNRNKDPQPLNATDYLGSPPQMEIEEQEAAVQNNGQNTVQEEDNPQRENPRSSSGSVVVDQAATRLNEALREQLPVGTPPRSPEDRCYGFEIKDHGPFDPDKTFDKLLTTATEHPNRKHGLLAAYFKGWAELVKCLAEHGEDATRDMLA